MFCLKKAETSISVQERVRKVGKYNRACYNLEEEKSVNVQIYTLTIMQSNSMMA